MAPAKSFPITKSTLALVIPITILSVLSIFFIKHNLIASSYDSESIVSFTGKYEEHFYLLNGIKRYRLTFTIQPNIDLEFTKPDQAKRILDAVSSTEAINIKVHRLQSFNSPLPGMKGYRAELIEASIN